MNEQTLQTENKFRLCPPKYLDKLCPLTSTQITLEQQKLLTAAQSGQHVLLSGPAGSGKTKTLLTMLNWWAEQDCSQQIWALAPNRSRAEYLSQSPVRAKWQQPRFFQTPAAISFRLVTEWATNRSHPYPQPQLMTGPEEEARLVKLLAELSSDWQWPEELGEDPVSNPYFIKELRQLLATCAHWGVDEIKLFDLAQTYQQPHWRLVSQLVTRYQPTYQEGKWDSAALVEEAIKCLEEADNEDLLHPLSIPKIIVLDDIQDCSAGVARLLAAFARRGSQLVVSANPECSVDGFRGAFPENLSYLQEQLKEVEIAELPERFLSSDWLAATTLTRAYVSPNSQVSVFFDPTAQPKSGQGKRTVKASKEIVIEEDQSARDGEQEKILSARKTKAIWLAGNLTQQFDQIALQLMKWRLESGIDWSEMAVITRDRQQLETLRLGLKMRELPLAPPTRAIQFNLHPATRPLLDAFCLAEAPTGQRSSLVQSLLQSTLFQTDSLMKARLDRIIALNWPDQNSAVDWFYDSLGSAELPAIHIADDLPGQTVLNRCAQTLAKARKFWLNPANPPEQLWEVWQATEAQDHWLEAALRGDDTADDNLDAIIALFKNCQVWSELNPDGDLRGYLEYLRELNHPQDTLGSRGQRLAGINLLTASSAGGKRFQAVIVVGLQESAWPNTVVRDWMLGASLLHDLQRGREVTTAGNRLIYDRTARIRETIKDEASLLNSALTRADQHLLVSLLETQDQAISGFARALALRWGVELKQENESSPVQNQKISDQVKIALDENDTDLPGVDRGPKANTLRTLVAEIRGELLRNDLSNRQREILLDTLVFLMANGVWEADPASWRQAGQGWQEAEKGAKQLDNDWWSDLSPVIPAQSPVFVTPSSVGSVQDCPLAWFLGNNGGSTPSGQSQLLGTLVHLIAEEIPLSPLPEKLAFLEQAWTTGKETWIDKHAWEEAVAAVERLHEYLVNNPFPALIETAIQVDLAPDLVLYSRMDRLEVTETGLRVVDFKTNKKANVVSQKQVYQHEQLLAYQLGLAELLANPQLASPPVRDFLLERINNGQGESRGAALAFLRVEPNKTEIKAGENPAGPALRRQLPLTPAQMEQEKYRLTQVGKIMRADSYPAYRGGKCRHCSLQSSCPLSGKGEQVL